MCLCIYKFSAPLEAAREVEQSLAPKTPRFAYAASLWNANPGYVLGDLVLGQAIRCRGSEHDLALMHTDELPDSSRRLLTQVWILQEVPYITADSNLFHSMGTRLDGVFTKLHALSLVKYTKVLMLDLDLAIMTNVDDLVRVASICRSAFRFIKPAPRRSL